MIDNFSLAQAYDEEYSRRVQKEEYIESQIEHYKKEAMQKFCKIIDSQYAETIARTIVIGYENEDDDAIEIINKLCLSDKHLAAVINDSSRMNELILEDQDQPIDEDHFI